MPRTDKLRVEVFPDADSIVEDNARVFTGIDFVSLVNDETYGPPALVAPNPKDPGAPPVARPGDLVLFVNTRLVPLFTVERVDG